MAEGLGLGLYGVLSRAQGRRCRHVPTRTCSWRLQGGVSEAGAIVGCFPFEPSIGKELLLFGREGVRCLAPRMTVQITSSPVHGFQFKIGTKPGWGSRVEAKLKKTKKWYGHAMVCLFVRRRHEDVDEVQIG